MEKIPKFNKRRAQVFLYRTIEYLTFWTENVFSLDSSANKTKIDIFSSLSSDDQGSCNVQVEPPKPVKLRNDTRFNNVKHDYTFSDISSNAPSRFPDMGYLMLGYDLYKGNPLTYGFDPGFRHPLFDYGKIENYETTLDGRHTHPVGTTALPARACTATFKKTIVNTVEDFQDRQTSALSQAFGYEHKGQDPADVIPNPATPATPGPATSSPTKKDKIKNAAKKVYAAGKKALAAGKRILASATAKVGSSFNEEFNAGKHSSNREDSTSIFAEAKCTVYRAKLNFEVSNFYMTGQYNYVW